MPRVRFSSFATAIVIFGLLGGSAMGQSCFDCQWYYQTIDYQGKSTSISDVVGDLDSPVYLERKEATDGLIDEFTDWLRADTGPNINLHIGVDLIEMQFDSFRHLSREASFRIDYIIAMLRDEVSQIIRARNRMNWHGTVDGYIANPPPFDWKWGAPHDDIWQQN